MTKNTKHHIRLYNNMKRRAIFSYKKNRLEDALDYIYSCANLAWHFHLGIWVDDDLDELLKNIGSNIGNPARHNKHSADSKKDKDSKILYIASFLMDIGGHSEALKQWVTLLKGDVSVQKVLVTNVSPYVSAFPNLNLWLKKIGVEVNELEAKDRYVTRIGQVVALIQREAPDYIVLFINPSDVVAISAIASLLSRPKIVYFNHADHAFWLGRSIVNALVDLRQVGAKISRQYRKIDNSYVIPLMSDIKPRECKKSMFNIPEDATISVSIGGFHKISKDYFKTIERILKKSQKHYHLFVTTPPEKKTLHQFLPSDISIRKRFIVDGPISDLSSIYYLADLIIETFPVIGATVRTEAVKCKIPIVAYRDIQFPLFSEDDVLPSNYTFRASSEEGIITHSLRLINNESLRKQTGNMLYEYYENNFNSKRIHDLLAQAIFGENSEQGQEMIGREVGYSVYGSYDIEHTHLWGRIKKYQLFRELMDSIYFKDNNFSFWSVLDIYIRAILNKEINLSEIRKIYFPLLLKLKAPHLYKYLRQAYKCTIKPIRNILNYVANQ